MRKFIKYIAAVLVAMTFLSCNQNLLDIPQKGAIPESDFYKTDEDCEAALAGLYAAILHSPYAKFFTYFYAVNAQLSDEVYTCDKGYGTDTSHKLMLYTHDSSHSYINSGYMALFAIVYRANLVIDNFKDSNSAIASRAVAEAQVLRSWAYIYIISLWGNPPIVDHVLRTSDEFRQPNASKEDLWAFVINTLDEAIASNGLKSKSSVDDKTAVWVTKEFAIALKGKAQVFTGDYSGAKATLKQVIDSKKYALIPGDQLADLFFTAKGNANTETMFETHSVFTEDNYKDASTRDQWAAYNPVRFEVFGVKPDSYLLQYPAGWNHWTPTYKFANAIIKNEGLNSNRVKAWFYTYEDELDMGLIEFNEFRGKANAEFLASSSFDKPDKACPSKVAADYCAETMGFWQRKLTILPEDIWHKNYEYDNVNRRWFRYAEVLLLYAEACAQLGETSGDGLDALNAIAQRAGAPTYSSLNMENVKKEKWFEMWGENTRFIDLVRWGDAAKELEDHNNTLPVFFGYKAGKSGKDILPDGSNIYDVYEVRFLDVQALTGVRHSFDPNKHGLLPYPNTEIANNPELIQNPGW